MSWIKMPYPSSGLFTNTWVTAPISFPFWIMGLPLIPWTIPPVSSSSFSSVTSVTPSSFRVVGRPISRMKAARASMPASASASSPPKWLPSGKRNCRVTVWGVR